MEQKILVVDDEQRMRKLVKDFLVRENFTVLRMAKRRSMYFWQKKILI